jgi:Raf kinase inhibitor-like YbhB/YbcL family protein
MKKLFIAVFAFFLFGCAATNAPSSSPLNPSPMKLFSSAFQNNGVIPKKYTCDGENISPPLSWTDVPDGTKSFVLIHDDPDAVPVAGYVWDHWILINIPSDTKDIAENNRVGVEMINSFQQISYGGPCPPNGEHRYYFKLYALDTMLNIPGKSSKADIEKAIEGHVLAKAELIGTYDRKK